MIRASDLLVGVGATPLLATLTCFQPARATSLAHPAIPGAGGGGRHA
jgi:hypothetical protein